MTSVPRRIKDRQSGPLVVAFVGLAIGVLIIVSLLSSIDWDASALLRVGEGDPTIVAYVEDRLDHVRPFPELGGQRFPTIGTENRTA